MLPGGLLKVHADFNLHQRLGLERRLNALLYLNRDWSDTYGGHLELWNRTMSRCERRVAPVFNRCVVFATSDSSFHGHPEPLSCPPGRSRRSIALYYYTAPRQGRPPAAHSTLFRARPDERVRTTSARRLARRLVPPLLADAVRSGRRRLGTRK